MASIYTVAQVNSYIKNMFAQDYLLSSVSVKGEVSNLTYHAKGHIYFTLKDKLSVISCVMWASNRKGLSFSLTEGMQIIVTGQIGTYEPAGKYQLYATSVKEDGLGELYIKFGELKQELEDRGMFAPEYKLPIPKTCRTLGVVTAPTGAAIRDIISISKSRDPYIQIVLYPALVQGEGAAAQVAEAIRFFNESYPVDVLIVGRGGGSMEDLWAFNEECVVRAVYASRIPVISAVGHETDFTLADFAADVRAATPSNAAELAVPDRADLQRHVAGLMTRLSTQAHKGIESRRLRLAALLRSRVLQEPQTLLAERRQRLDAALRQLCQLAQQAVMDKRHAVSLALEKLDGMNPARVLQRGYVAAEKDGQLVTRAAQLRPHDRLSLVLQDGRVAVEVMDKAVKAEKPRTRKEGK